MEKVWLLGELAVCVARVDFHDPALAADPEARERGVRVEVRPLRTTPRGSVYASDPVSLDPATVRIDLLESRPHAADRMHWHPVVTDGEPGDRVFDPALSADPVAWTGARLSDLVTDTDAVADVLREVELGLAWARQPWPSVTHDERGFAAVP